MNKAKISRQYNKFLLSSNSKKLSIRWTQTIMTVSTLAGNVVRNFVGLDIWSLRKQLIEWVFSVDTTALLEEIIMADTKCVPTIQYSGTSNFDDFKTINKKIDLFYQKAYINKSYMFCDNKQNDPF